MILRILKFTILAEINWHAMPFFFLGTKSVLIPCFPFNRRTKGFQLLQENQKARIKRRRRSIKSTKTGTRIRTRSTRSTNIVTKTEAKTKTRTKRKIKVGIVIPVLITQRNTMKRFKNFSLLHLHCPH